MVAKHLIITGRVQGVWYRKWMADTARKLNLTGWVRNRANGSVESVMQGEEEAIRAMIGHCHKGPPRALVECVTV